MRRFNGFPKQTPIFLEELARNNERAWFEANKARYEDLVREPALAFIEEIAPRLERISYHFTALAKRSGGSLMRVYRDTRFSRDKTPYKTNIGIQFRHRLGKDVHAPGFYLHIDPKECFLGAGIWHPDPKTLTKIRNFISDNPAAWQAALAHKPFRRDFQLVGSSLTRLPRCFASDHPLIVDLKRKDYLAIKTFAPEQIHFSEFIEFVCSGYIALVPLMRYLCAAVDVEF